MTSEAASTPNVVPIISRRTFARLDDDHRRGDPDQDTAQVGRDTVENGCVFTPVRVVEKWPLFEPGRTVMTTNAERHLEAVRLDPITVYTDLLERHLGGDWGKCYVEDFDHNDEALREGYRLFSVYDVAGETYWLITEAPSAPQGPRVATTLLLPDDY